MNRRLTGFYWTRFLSDRVVCGLATGGRLGYLSRAPGTLGSFLGLILFTIFFYGAPVFSQVMALMFLCWVAVGICGEAELRLQKRDPGEIILDEVVAVPICYIGIHHWTLQTGFPWLYIVVGFVLFRFFDILKPLGINRLQFYPGGTGVVADDVGAALATLLLLHLMGFAWTNFL